MALAWVYASDLPPRGPGTFFSRWCWRDRPTTAGPESTIQTRKDTMSRCFVSVLRPVFILLLGLTFVTATTALAVPAARQADLVQINDLMRQGLRDEALPLCRQYTKSYPGDPDMLYNLACLENTTGNPKNAVAAFQAALAAGFGEFEMATTDKDLQGDIHPEILALIVAEKKALAARARAQSLTLDLDQWSEPREMIPEQANGAPASHPSLRLAWHDNGLELELIADSDWEEVVSLDKIAPWSGGSGLLVSLSIPDGSSDWESTNHFLFAFGLGPKGGIGGMYVASQEQWQPVTDLTPKIKVDEKGTLRLTSLIPWLAVMPYNPLVDTPLGINATLLMRGPEQQQRASLVRPQDTLYPQAARRRYAH